MKKIALFLLMLLFALPVLGNAQETAPRNDGQSSLDHPLPVKQHNSARTPRTHRVKAPKHAKSKARHRGQGVKHPRHRHK